MAVGHASGQRAESSVTARAGGVERLPYFADDHAAETEVARAWLAAKLTAEQDAIDAGLPGVRWEDVK